MKAIILSCLLLFGCQNVCLGQWFVPETAENTVLLEKKEEDGRIVPYGTGFLLYNYETPNTSVVITCAHLLVGHSTIFLRMNVDSSLVSNLQRSKGRGVVVCDRPISAERNSIRFQIDLIQDTTRYFVKHPTLDIGAFTFMSPVVVADTSVFKVARGRSIGRSMMRFRKDISIGDEVYFVGFPFGIGTDDSVEPLVRSGSVAWVSERSKEFLLDAFSYGGNSGSPVFLKQSFGSKPGELNWEASLLVGMIIGHHGLPIDTILTQVDPATLKPVKGLIETNVGLARCLYVDDIVEVADQAQKLRSPH